MQTRYVLIAALLQIELVTCFIDPVTITLGLGAWGGYYVYKNIYNKCTTNECDNDDWIPIKVWSLRTDLDRYLHGQQIVKTTVLRAIEGYKNTKEPPKALTMSFHGLPGSGKNFVAKMIADAFFKKGTQSQYYNFFNGRSYAPVASRLEHYKEEMRDTIVSSLLACTRSMFVFDEVDMMPVGLLNVLVPFIDYTGYTGVSYEGRHTYVETNKAIFIFLSNTGSNRIMDQMLSFWEQGKNRKDMILADFENLISVGAFNEKGGFHKSDTIRTSLIDYYVPFLPLEEEHIRMCMRDAFEYRYNKPTKSMEDEVLSVVTWGPEPHNIYAKSGCKKIEPKVISVVYQQRFES